MITAHFLDIWLIIFSLCYFRKYIQRLMRLKFGEKGSLCKCSQAGRKQSFVLPLGAGCTDLQAAHEGGTSTEELKTWKILFYHSDTYALWDHLFQAKVLPNLGSKNRQCTSLKGVEKQLNLNHFHSGSFQVRSRNIYLSALCLFAIVSPLLQNWSFSSVIFSRDTFQWILPVTQLLFTLVNVFSYRIYFRSWSPGICSIKKHFAVHFIHHIRPHI